MLEGSQSMPEISNGYLDAGTSAGGKARKNGLTAMAGLLVSASSMAMLTAGMTTQAAACTTDATTLPGTNIVTCVNSLSATDAPVILIDDSGLAGAIGGDGQDATSGGFLSPSVSATPGGAGGNGSPTPNYQIVNSGALTGLGISGAHGLNVIVRGGDAGYGGRGGIDSFGFGGQPGGAGGNGGTPGAVEIQNSGDIVTQAVTSHGIFLLSFGGSGGQGGQQASSGQRASGGAGGNGGEIAIQNSARITTTELASSGIFAATVGGSGGQGHNAGSGGHGGAAAITNDASGVIATLGDDSHGIDVFSQGGVGGVSPSVFFGGTNGDAGNGGEVTVTNAGSITTEGGAAHGIKAHSISGGVGGTSSIVRVNNSGSISATGIGSYGIEAVSADVDVIVDLQPGSNVVGGDRHGAGVRISTGEEATIYNYGSLSALSDEAVSISAVSSATIYNHGTISGTVTQLGFDNDFFNQTGALFESGINVDLNGNGTLWNSATLSPGGAGTIQSTTVNGHYRSNSSSTLLVDADWANDTADRVDVNQDAELVGTVVVNPISFPDSNISGNAGLQKQWTIITVNGFMVVNGFAVTDTAAVDYELLYPDAHTVDLQATINFLGSGGGGGGGAGGGGGLGTGGLNSNQTSVGTTLNKVVGGGGSFGFVPDILGLGTQGELKDALNQLTPAGDGAGFSSAMGTGQTFAGQLLSCRVAGEGDANAVIREGQCVWARGTGRRLDNDGGESGVGFKEDAAFFSGGMQFDIGGNWRVGGGLGYEALGLSTDSRAESEGERAHIGGVIKYNPGPWLFAASVTGGYGWFDNKRAVAFGNFASVATSDYNDKFVTGQLTAAHQVNLGRDLYLKPQIMAGITHLNRDGYQETAARDVGLSVEGSSDTVFSLSPSLELGGQVVMGHGIARPYLRAGLTWRSEDTFSTTANFSAAPGAANAFTVTSSVDDVVADIGAGIDFIAPGNTALRFEYGGQFGEQTTQHSGSAKISVPF